MAKIVQKEAKVLREKAKEVPITEITSPKFKKLIAEMKKALAKEEDGIALAAPQIGASWRIFIVSKKLPVFANKEATPLANDLIFINPEIKKVSKEKTWLPEGCLSCRWLYGEVKRSTKCTVKAYNEKGGCFELGASGLLAQVFQHEIDHLNGILFIDKAKSLEEYKPEK